MLKHMTGKHTIEGFRWKLSMVIDNADLSARFVHRQLLDD